ncbi:NrdJb [Candidatus Rariloculus sp.]|uniref:TSCPD domain-containing protein n=1 Tax=Candidatus Rariloculus sp. TaxID=3101265 RepID=UPI003D115C3F
MAQIRIDGTIVKYAVARHDTDGGSSGAGEPRPKEKSKDNTKVIRMHEKLERPEMLIGSTYKVKTPVSDHAMYVTINDIVLNENTEHEKRRPFEIFINSKNLDHYQWIVALTRIMSAVFRKGGDVAFLVDELKAVFDPRGGYWQPGGTFMPSIIAELGYIVEKHLTRIGMLKSPAPTEEQQKFIDEKLAEYKARGIQQDAFAESSYPKGARLCGKCSVAASVMLDGCMVCLNCGYSKCG